MEALAHWWQEVIIALVGGWFQTVILLMKRETARIDENQQELRSEVERLRRTNRQLLERLSTLENGGNQRLQDYRLDRLEETARKTEQAVVALQTAITERIRQHAAD